MLPVSCTSSVVDIVCMMELVAYSIIAVFTLAGAILLTYLGIWVLYSIFYSQLYVHYLASALGRRVNLKKMGQWAVITGATDGIGKAYAEELARLGIDVVLISRTQQKLDDVAKSIEAEFKVNTKVIAVDFTRTDIYNKIKEHLKDLEVGILVNNVGMSYDYPEYFLDVQGGEETFENMVNCNLTSCIRMTYMLLPGMVYRHRGVILNLSSTAAVFPSPFLNVYSATKVSVDYFSNALQAEYKSQGIIVQSVIPFFVATNMSKIRKTSLFVPTPRNYVKSQLKTIGLESRTFGYPAHKVQGWFLEFMVHMFPRRFTNSIMYGTLKDMNNRARIIKAKNNKKTH